MPGACPVVLVEDDAEIRSALRDLLEDEGYPVLEAENGAVALDVLRSSPKPCVIFLDLMMPVMDGWTLLEKLRADETLRDVAVVVVSAVADRRPEGAASFIPKPIQVDRLLETAARLCA